MSDTADETSTAALPEEAREFFKDAGRKGGNRTLKTHGTSHFAEIGRKGGKATRAKTEAKKTKKPKAKKA